MEFQKNHGPFPDDPGEQNSRWYEMYSTLLQKPSVLGAHKSFLFTRDYAALSFIFLVLFGPIGFIVIPSLSTASTYLALLGFQYFIVRKVAKGNGIGMVKNVLAIKATEKQQ